MKIKVKKIISLVVMVGLISSQIGCAGKVTKISAPIDQVKFDKDYTYGVKLKDGKQIRNVEGLDIVPKKNNLVLKTKTEEKSLSGQDIYQINGTSNKPIGRHTVTGLKIGAITGGLIVGLPLAAAASSIAENGWTGESDGNGNGVAAFFLGLLVGGAIGGFGGGLIGAGVGTLIPRHNKIQITPTIEPTSSGVNAGANLSIKF